MITIDTPEALDGLPDGTLLCAHWADGSHPQALVLLSGETGGAGAGNAQIYGRAMRHHLLSWECTLIVLYDPSAPAPVHVCTAHCEQGQGHYEAMMFMFPLDADAAEEAYQRGFQDGFWNGKTTDMTPAQVAAFMAPYRARDLSLDKRLSPVHPLGDKWKVGARVESVFRPGPYGPEETRPGTLDRIDRTYGYHESLVVRFDDGEVRDINPDVMRHIRTEA